jgi:hypothetical protein
MVEYGIVELDCEGKLDTALDTLVDTLTSLDLEWRESSET